MKHIEIIVYDDVSDKKVSGTINEKQIKDMDDMFNIDGIQMLLGKLFKEIKE